MAQKGNNLLLKRVHNLIIAAGLFTAGTICANYKYFSIDRTISMTEIVVALLSAYVTIHIATKIQGYFNKNNRLYDLYKEDIKKLIIQIDIIKEKVNSNDYLLSDCIVHCKKFNQDLYEFWYIYKSSSVLHEDYYQGLHLHFRDFREKLTASPCRSGYLLIDIDKKENCNQELVSIKESLIHIIL